MSDARARRALWSFPSVHLGYYPTPVEELPRLRAVLGGGPRLLVKRDDAIPFGFGGNKVRKLEMVLARAVAEEADTLVTIGGVQSNHARVTAAAAAKLGLKCVLVTNGTMPEKPTANAFLNRLLGAEVEYVATRDDRVPMMRATAERLRREGRRPFEIPLGASTSLGALAFARAVSELVDQIPAPDAIFHAASSGGTQAGLLAGCELYGLKTDVIGISADDPAPALRSTVSRLVSGAAEMLGLSDESFCASRGVLVDDGFVGDGYGILTRESREAIALLAQTEALFLDPTYTAKAMAALISYVRASRFREDETLLFWHTGGQVGLFADAPAPSTASQEKPVHVSV